MTLLHHKKNKGFGIIEILISLAIFAIGVISITSLNAKTYRVIKNNELSDFADRTMVKALEYFKSPTTSDIQDKLEGWILSGGGTEAYCSIISTSTIDESIKLEFEYQDAGNYFPKPPTCLSGNPYKLNTSAESIYKDFYICEQIFVEKMTNGYKITSKVVYKIDTETKTNQLIGYRPFTYEGN
jgi:prepilin-type N-terminal cleavage/methylation domain-containing protein